MKLIIMNRAKATPAVFDTVESADAAVKKTMVAFRRVRECRVVDERLLQHYVEEVFGDEYYTTYEIYDGIWYVHERAPYDTAACDWCSLGGRFCEYCDTYGEDPYENCGTEIDFALFLEWLDKGGAL